MARLHSFSLLVFASLLLLVLVSSKSSPRVKTNALAFASKAENSAHALVMNNLSTHIKKPALLYALQGYDLLGEGVREDLMIIIDFSLPSTEERFFAINPQTGELLYKKLVAHGQGTGNLYAENFSNIPGSHQSSLGFYRTAETYTGKNGLSLRLDGLQRGLNSEARNRAIVIHAADYVSYSFIAQNGHLGRSWGCPALPEDDFEEIINTIAQGTLLLIYHPQLIGASGQL